MDPERGIELTSTADPTGRMAEKITRSNPTHHSRWLQT
jgi:hypothetical protein